MDGEVAELLGICGIPEISWVARRGLLGSKSMKDMSIGRSRNCGWMN